MKSTPRGCGARRGECGAATRRHSGAAGRDIPLYTGLKLSRHQVAFQEVLGLARIRGRLPPHLHLIGVQPADLSVGVGLSTIIEAALPQVVEWAASVVQD